MYNPFPILETKEDFLNLTSDGSDLDPYTDEGAAEVMFDLLKQMQRLPLDLRTLGFKSSPTIQELFYELWARKTISSINWDIFDG